VHGERTAPSSATSSARSQTWRRPFPPSLPEFGGTLIADSSLRPRLETNALYFLWAHTSSSSAGPGSSADVIWPWNNTGIQGTIRQVGLTNRTFVGTLSAFQINGEHSPVPEPATVM
jgi:hypothetical protein